MRRNRKVGLGIIVVAILVFFGASIMPVQWNSGTSLQTVGLNGNSVTWCLYPCTQITADASPSFVNLNCGILGVPSAVLVAPSCSADARKLLQEYRMQLVDVS